MFLKQWYQAILAEMTTKGFSFTDITGTTKSGTINTTLFGVDVFGSTNSGYPYIGRVNNGYGSGVSFGSGNAKPTFDDYCFSGNVVKIDGTNISATVAVNIINNGLTGEVGATYTIVNNTSDPIVIGEVALCMALAGSSSGGTGSGYAMLERTALETPITIDANGGVGKVTYTISITAPTT